MYILEYPRVSIYLSMYVVDQTIWLMRALWDRLQRTLQVPTAGGLRGGALGGLVARVTAHVACH